MLQALELRLEQQLRPSDADTPVEQVRPLLRPGQGREDRLHFDLVANFSCPLDMRPELLLVSITDSMVVLDGSTLDSPAETRISVPVRQLRMFTPATLCAEQAAGTISRLPQSLTAFGSLVCRDEEERQRKTTSTVPLDIWLYCPADAPAAAADR